jgi:ABC-type Na+ efflux pump permease subunit
VHAGWWGDTWLVARREIDERSRAKSFWITTAIMILAVVAAVVIPAIVSHNHNTEKVGVLGAGDPALTRAAIEAGRVTGNRVQVPPVASLDAARSELRSGTLTAVIGNGGEVLIKQQPVSGTTSSTATFSGATSRVVEVMLATLRPTQLLTGKVISFAALAFAQMLALGATFAICGIAVGSHAIRGTAGSVALIGGLWLTLGFALYCSAFAAAGALITRQADASNAVLPLLIPLIVAYSLSNGVLFNGANSFYHVLAFIPWTAPVAMPTMFAIGAAPAWQVIASALSARQAAPGSARQLGLSRRSHWSVRKRSDPALSPWLSQRRRS